MTFFQDWLQCFCMLHATACHCIRTSAPCKSQQTRMKLEKLLPEVQVAVWMEECGSAAGVLLQSACTQQQQHHLLHLHHPQEAQSGYVWTVPLAVLKWTAPRLCPAFVFYGGMRRTAENWVCLTNRVRHQPRRWEHEVCSQSRSTILLLLVVQYARREESAAITCYIW